MDKGPGPSQAQEDCRVSAARGWPPREQGQHSREPNLAPPEPAHVAAHRARRRRALHPAAQPSLAFTLRPTSGGHIPSFSPNGAAAPGPGRALPCRIAGRPRAQHPYPPPAERGKEGGGAARPGEQGAHSQTPPSAGCFPPPPPPDPEAQAQAGALQCACAGFRRRLCVGAGAVVWGDGGTGVIRVLGRGGAVAWRDGAQG